MSTYRITATEEIIAVECDGTPIEMKPCRSFARPLYAVGERSDGSINVAYTVLLHCCGQGEAEQLSEDFVSEFLLAGPPLDIPSDRIKTFVDRTCKVQFEAQEAVRNMKPIGGANKTNGR